MHMMYLPSPRPPPQNRKTDGCEEKTFPQLRWRAVNIRIAKVVSE